MKTYRVITLKDGTKFTVEFDQPETKEKDNDYLISIATWPIIFALINYFITVN